MSQNRIKQRKELILVTGANGFIGAALCVELLERGFSVRGAVRLEKSTVEGVERAVVGALNDETQWDDALRGVDVIIHLAARVHVRHDDAKFSLDEFRRVNLAGTEHLARCAAASGVRRLVYASSIKVNGEETCGAEKFTEMDVPSPQDAYGISKMEAERALHRVAEETGMEIVIVRPPLVYGVGVKGNFAQMLRVLSKGVPLPLAKVKNQRSLIYLGNLVDALILCATHPSSVGQTYLVSDGEDISSSDLLRQLGAEMGHPARLFPCPVVLLKLAGRMAGKVEQIKRILGSLRVDSDKIRRELGWIPPFGVRQGLKRTAHLYQAGVADQTPLLRQQR